MTDSPLKSVFTLDTESQTYKPAAHNLSAGQAVEQFNTDESAKIVEQGQRHRNPDPRKCQACKKSADELTARHNETASGGDTPEEAELEA
jgi:hypothetical protein